MNKIKFYVGLNIGITEDEVNRLNRAHSQAETKYMKVLDYFTLNVGECTYIRIDNNDGTLTVYKMDNRNRNSCWAIIAE